MQAAGTSAGIVPAMTGIDCSGPILALFKIPSSNAPGFKLGAFLSFPETVLFFHSGPVSRSDPGLVFFHCSNPEGASL